MQTVRDYLQAHQADALETLKALLRIPSVSAITAHKPDVRRAAEFVREQLASAGLTTELVETAGHPIVYAEWLKAENSNAPTVLIYGHYDVQPPDPLDKWITPAFEPTVRDGLLFARGATDDKGQMLTHVLSVAAWLKAVGKLPINVKFVIEGEEEVGSNNLDIFLAANREKLRSDIAVISDTSQYAPNIPAITYGLRGILACEVRVIGPQQDLHSGIFGGAITNPAIALARLIASLHDANGRVQIPGFYDDVKPLTDSERAGFAALPFNERDFLASVGVESSWGETGFTSTERRWARPTCEINGLTSGYQGEGPKTIIPSWASAKITCRLVPNQYPHKLTKSLGQFLQQQLLPGCRLEFVEAHGCPGFVADANSPFMDAAKSAIQDAFGTKPVMIREGGSIPVVGTLKELLGVDTLLLGWGQNTDNLHSPNEHFAVADFHRGTLASALLWQRIADRCVSQ
jgi:acetylornithine deacetylase/succinyl-diaminopimelate desuccinylase-like protein